MQPKNDGRPAPATPPSADKADDGSAPATGLTAVLAAALQAKTAKRQLPGGNAPGGPHGPDRLNKAPKPAGGANRTMGPRRGHR